MVVEQVRRHQPLEMPLIHDDHVVQQVASATSHPALRNTVLPRTAKGRALCIYDKARNQNLLDTPVVLWTVGLHDTVFRITQRTLLVSDI
jgi:hypothetical protein